MKIFDHENQRGGHRLTDAQENKLWALCESEAITQFDGTPIDLEEDLDGDGDLVIDAAAYEQICEAFELPTQPAR